MDGVRVLGAQRVVSGDKQGSLRQGHHRETKGLLLSFKGNEVSRFQVIKTQGRRGPV